MCGAQKEAASTRFAEVPRPATRRAPLMQRGAPRIRGAEWAPTAAPEAGARTWNFGKKDVAKSPLGAEVGEESGARKSLRVPGFWAARGTPGHPR